MDKKILGIFLIVLGIMIALFLFLSKKEYELISLVIPLVIWTVGLWLFFKRKEVDKF